MSRHLGMMAMIAWLRDGGAIRVEGELSQVALINTTFNGNRAASFGGGMDNRGVATVTILAVGDLDTQLVVKGQCLVKE